MPLRTLLFVFLFISVLLARAATAGTPVSCDQLWSSHHELKSIDMPIYYSPSFPSSGVVEDFHMSELKYPDGSRFYVNDIEQSNCFLDRILDATIQDAIRSGAHEAAEAAKQQKDISADAWADLVLDRIDSHLAVARGLPSNSSYGNGYLDIILSNIESIYGLDEHFATRPNPFVKLANRNGFFGPVTMSTYILFSYADHLLGVKNPYFEKFIEEHQMKAAAKRFVATLIAKSAATVGKPPSDDCLANTKSPVTVGAELATIFGSYIDSDWSFAISASCQPGKSATRQFCTLSFAHEDEENEALPGFASAGFKFFGNPADGAIDTDTLECFQGP